MRPFFYTMLPQKFLIPIFIFLAILLSYLYTSPPSIYTVDSPELSSAAYTLGIAHAPSYPLYILVAHIFSQIPISSHIAYQLNFFSIISLALATILLYINLNNILKRNWIAAVSSLIFAWSYYVWKDGIVAEVYAFQVLLLNLCFLALWHSYQKPTWGKISLTGLSYGLAVAAHPANIFFAPAVIYVFLMLEITWSKRLAAGTLSLVIFLLFMLYLPLRYLAEPTVNMLGHYNQFGEFERLNLLSLEGLWAALSGAQFREIFPHSFGNLIEAAWWFWGNFLGIGIVLGCFGLFDLWQKARPYFFLWLLAFLPYGLFFASYGVEDRDTMLLPAYWLWIFPLAYSINSWGKKNYERIFLLILPCLFFVINFPRVNVSQNLEPYTISLEYAQSFPENAEVFGYWGDIVALEYLQIVEGRRPDVQYYNLSFFEGDMARLEYFLTNRLQADATIIFLNDSAALVMNHPSFLLTSFQADTDTSFHQIHLR